MQGNAVRVFTNSGLEMVWAKGRDEYYDIYTDAQTIYKFTNKQLRVVLGAGFEVEIGDNLYLVNDFYLNTRLQIIMVILCLLM